MRAVWKKPPVATSVSEAAAGCAAGRAALGVAPGDAQGRTAAFSASASAASRPVKPRGAQCLHHYLSGGGGKRIDLYRLVTCTSKTSDHGYLLGTGVWGCANRREAEGELH